MKPIIIILMKLLVTLFLLAPIWVLSFIVSIIMWEEEFVLIASGYFEKIWTTEN
jgi:hypothetical protein